MVVKVKKVFGYSKALLLCLFLLIFTNISFAQSSSGGNGPGSGGFSPPNDLPVNDGVVYLLIVGFILGGYTIYRKFMPKKLNTEAFAS